MKTLLLSFTLLFFIASYSQNKKIKVYLKKDSSAFMQFNGLGQIWVRYNQSNPGTTVHGTAKSNTFDIGLRRWRFSIVGKVAPKLYFYTQFGQNNFNYMSPKYTGAFFHDGFMEYEVTKSKFFVGAGLSGWNGLSRYASPSIGTLMALDAPLYQQITNSVNDQFLRKLSVHTKGLIGRFNYRLALTTPMVVQTTRGYEESISSEMAVFSPEAPQLQYQGYFMFHFKDVEKNTTPYTVGTYLGNKSVFNVGTGFIYQPDAMWYLNENNDTTFHQMLGLGTDLFIDKPINSKKALTLYSAYHYFDFGKNYIRNVGAMNPANGNNRSDVVNGAGNAYPMMGTGDSFYTQIGFLFKELNDENASIQPYLAGHFANYEGLDELMSSYQMGINYHFHGTHAGKLSAEVQNRPVYTNQSDGSNTIEVRKNMFVLQMQLAF